MATRKTVNGNLIYNGNFEYLPSSNVATTTSSRWMDGTASGSLTNGIFGWFASYPANNASVFFDTTVRYNKYPTIKLSTLDATGRARAWTTNNATTSAVTASARPYMIPLRPKTSYTLSAYAKTNNVVGTSMSIYQYTGDWITSATTGTSTNAISGTNDFTLLTLTWTTNADCAWAEVILRNDTAGKISDAWFGNISLIET